MVSGFKYVTRSADKIVSVQVSRSKLLDLYTFNLPMPIACSVYLLIQILELHQLVYLRSDRF